MLPQGLPSEGGRFSYRSEFVSERRLETCVHLSHQSWRDAEAPALSLQQDGEGGSTLSPACSISARSSATLFVGGGQQTCRRRRSSWPGEEAEDLRFLGERAAAC